MIEYAEKKNVTILALPPHTSHLLQPLDLGFFHPFKAHLRKELHKQKAKIQKWDILKLLIDPWHIAITPGIVNKINNNFYRNYKKRI